MEIGGEGGVVSIYMSCFTGKFIQNITTAATPPPTLSHLLFPTHSPTHSPSHSPTHSPTHSPSHAPTHSPTHASYHSPIVSCTHPHILLPIFPHYFSPTFPIILPSTLPPILLLFSYIFSHPLSPFFLTLCVMVHFIGQIHFALDY